MLALQLSAKDNFINRESILNEMLSMLVDDRTRMGFYPCRPEEGG